MFKEGLKNCEVISDEKIKSYILKKSTFAVAKSGTISLEICNANVPSIIIYKINFINPQEAWTGVGQTGHALDINATPNSNSRLDW